MKLLKKSAFLQIFALSLILFSCASTPKTAENLPETSISGEELPETENSPASQDETENADTSGQDFSDLTEPLTKEQNPDLPELPELEQTESEIPENEAESSVIQEPQVKDEPSAEKNAAENQNQDEENDFSQDEKTQREENSAPETNPSEENLNDENSPGQNEQTGSSSPETENQETSNIIEETENSSKNEEIQPENDASQESQKPSRSVKIKKNQSIDIVYPGKGWIYQGNIDENGNIDARNRNFIFGGRKLGGKDTSFTLRSRNPGTYLLHFFKNDVLTGEYIDDFLEVTVENETASSAEHVTAPDYAEVVPPKFTITADNAKNPKIEKSAEKPAESGNLSGQKNASEPQLKNEKKSETENSKIDTIIQTSKSEAEKNSPAADKTENSSGNDFSEKKESANSAPKETNAAAENSGNSAENSSSSLENMSQDELLELAQKYYSDKKYQQAFSAISKFFDKATARLDEGLFLQGQILEEKSPVQNIKSAIESYDLVVNNYPSSSLWEKANKRSIFLKRFYINIR